MDRQRFGDALHHRAPELLPFNRPILASIEKFHKSGPREQFEDQGHEIVSQSPNRKLINVGVKSITCLIKFVSLRELLGVLGAFGPMRRLSVATRSQLRHARWQALPISKKSMAQTF